MVSCPSWYTSFLPVPVTCGYQDNNGSNPHLALAHYDKGCVDPIYADDTMAMYGVEQHTGKAGDVGHPYTGPPTTSAGATAGYDHECAGSAVNWLTCNLHNCSVKVATL